MKTRISPITFIILLHSFYSFSQITGVTIKNRNETDTTTVRINSTFLLLGTLNDYISHKYVTKQNQFDRYYEYEKPLMVYVDSLARKDFNVAFGVADNCFLSEKLTKKMDSLYVENALKESLFDTNEKKLSFLLGVYFRNGEKINDDIYKIQLANSPKHYNVYQILKQLNCQNIFYKRIDNIPTQYILYFQASGLMKRYFATIETKKEKLLDSKLNAIKASEKVKSDYKESIAKENLRIIGLFK